MRRDSYARCGSKIDEYIAVKQFLCNCRSVRHVDDDRAAALRGVSRSRNFPALLKRRINQIGCLSYRFLSYAIDAYLIDDVVSGLRRIKAGNVRRAVKKLQYLVRINKDPDSDWGASVPDLPGCVATGKTIDAALRRIQGAIELHLRGMRADGIQPPRPRRRAVVPMRTRQQVDFYASVEVAA